VLLLLPVLPVLPPPPLVPPSPSADGESGGLMRAAAPPLCEDSAVD
jgi:hypothetical protein